MSQTDQPKRYRLYRATAKAETKGVGFFEGTPKLFCEWDTPDPTIWEPLPELDRLVALLPELEAIVRDDRKISDEWLRELSKLKGSPAAAPAEQPAPLTVGEAKRRDCCRICESRAGGPWNYTEFAHVACLDREQADKARQAAAPSSVRRFRVNSCGCVFRLSGKDRVSKESTGDGCRLAFLPTVDWLLSADCVELSSTSGSEPAAGAGNAASQKPAAQVAVVEAAPSAGERRVRVFRDSDDTHVVFSQCGDLWRGWWYGVVSTFTERAMLNETHNHGYVELTDATADALQKELDLTRQAAQASETAAGDLAAQLKHVGAEREALRKERDDYKLAASAEADNADEARRELAAAKARITELERDSADLANQWRAAAEGKMLRALKLAKEELEFDAKSCVTRDGAARYVDQALRVVNDAIALVESLSAGQPAVDAGGGT